jgi:DNA-binding Xre family transcriptional regulator
MPAWKVRDIAEPQRWNVKTLAEATGLAYGTVYAIWNNQATRVDFDTLYRLAFVLHVAPSNLFGPGKFFRLNRDIERDGVTYNAVYETGMGEAFLTYVKPGSDFPMQPGGKYLVPAPENWRDLVTEEIK